MKINWNINPMHFIYVALISAALLFGWNRFNKWMDLKYEIEKRESQIKNLEVEIKALESEAKKYKAALSAAMAEIIKWEKADGKIERAESFDGAIDRLGIAK